jgi:hypothetical protein
VDWPPPEPAPGALPEPRPLEPEEPLPEEPLPEEPLPEEPLPEEPLLEALPEEPLPEEPLPELCPAALEAGRETAGAGAEERDRCAAEGDGRALDARVAGPDFPLARADPARLTPSTPAAATLAAVTVVVTARTRA